MSCHEQTSESDSLGVLEASYAFGPVCVENPVAQALPEYVLDWNWLLDLVPVPDLEHLLRALVLLLAAGWGESSVVCTYMPETFFQLLIRGTWNHCHSHPSFDCTRSAQSVFGPTHLGKESAGTLRGDSI